MFGRKDEDQATTQQEDPAPRRVVASSSSAYVGPGHCATQFTAGHPPRFARRNRRRAQTDRRQGPVARR